MFEKCENFNQICHFLRLNTLSQTETIKKAKFWCKNFKFSAKTVVYKIPKPASFFFKSEAIMIN